MGSKKAPFILIFLIFNLFLQVQAAGLLSEKEVFERYVYFDPFHMPEARVIRPRLLTLGREEWKEAVSVFTTYLEGREWWERKGAAEALGIILSEEKVFEILGETNPQEARFLKEKWWMRVQALQSYHREQSLEYESLERAVPKLKTRIGISDESLEIVHLYLSGISLMYRAFVHEETAENADFLLQAYQKVVTMDVDGNGEIDGEDYDEVIKRENEADKIRLSSELAEKKKWLEAKFNELSEEDWERWVSWMKDERYMGDITWHGEWRWREEHIGEWREDFVLSSEKIAALIFALTDYKEHLEFVLSMPEWRSSISREQFFLLIDSLFGPTARSQHIKREVLKKTNITMREQFQYVLSYYGQVAPEEEGEVQVSALFEKLKPSFSVNIYEGKITALQGFTSRTGFTTVEKFYLLQEYFSFIQTIYENYMAHHKWKSQDDFYFKRNRWDEISVSKNDFEAGLNLCLEFHQGYQFEQKDKGFSISLSPLAKVSLEKQSFFDVGDENDLEPQVLNQARFTAFEFLLKNKIVALSSLPEFYTNPEALASYVHIPEELNSEFRETALHLPGLPIVLGVDRTVGNAQFLWSEEFARSLMQLMREKREKGLKEYRKKIEATVEQVVSPYHLEVNGLLYRTPDTPREENIENVVKELGKFSFEFGESVNWEEVNTLLLQASRKQEEIDGIANNAFKLKLRRFKEIVKEAHPLAEYWKQRRELMVETLKMSLTLRALDQEMTVLKTEIEADTKRIESIRESLATYGVSVREKIAEKKKRLEKFPDATLRDQLLNDFITHLKEEERSLNEELGNLKNSTPQKIEKLLELNAEWVSRIATAPYLLINITEMPFDQFMKKPYYYYQWLADQRANVEAYGDMALEKMPEEYLQQVFNKALKITLKNIDDTIVAIARLHTYEERLSLLNNPYILFELATGKNAEAFKPTIEKLVQKYKVIEKETNRNELLVRYATVPVFLVGSFFLTGGVGTVFFISGLVALDVVEYYYVYVQDYRGLEREYSQLQTNLPDAEYRFGNYAHMDGLRRELYGFPDPEGVFQWLESFGSINWFQASLTLDACALFRPIKAAKYIWKMHKL